MSKEPKYPKNSLGGMMRTIRIPRGTLEDRYSTLGDMSNPPRIKRKK